MKIAAIDQGTTSTRLLLVETLDGGATCTARIVLQLRHRQSHPAPGFVEHDPLELLSNVRACLAAAGRVDAVAIANQGESCLAWDAVSGEPLSPVIVWQDDRTTGILARLAAAGAAPLVLSRAGLPLDPYFSAAKLAWIVENCAPAKAALAAGRLRLGTTDAFFLDRLTKRFATDVTTASRTSLMDLGARSWDEDLCALFGVPVECLPEIRPTVGPFGDIDGMPVLASVVDQQAALYGHGCREPGDAKITFGTGAFALAVTGAAIVRAPERGLLPTLAWEAGGHAVYAVDGGVYDAGAAVEWACRIGIADDLTAFAAFAFAAPAAIDRGLVFVPALSGLACPHWDRSAASLFIGMSAATTRADLCQALIEGVALRSAEVVAAIDAHVPIGETIGIDGGLARSDHFAQFLADSLDRTVMVGTFDERTAFGAAALAARALGVAIEAPAGNMSKSFVPRAIDRRGRSARFADAIARSRAWRGAGSSSLG